MGGHGYSAVQASAKRIDVEFVCIPRPIERALSEDGVPLRYRVRHGADLWERGQNPRLDQKVLEGDAELSI